jgi:hypothetical protein
MKKKMLAFVLSVCSLLYSEEFQELYTGGFTLKNANVAFSPMVFYPGWHNKASIGNFNRNNDTPFKWRIPAMGEKYTKDYCFTGDTKFTVVDKESVRADFDFETVKDVEILNLFISANLKIEDYAGGKVLIDGKRVDIPLVHKQQVVFSTKLSRLEVFYKSGKKAFTVVMSSPVAVFMQDNRYTVGGVDFSLRFYLKKDKCLTKKGEKNSLSMTVTSSDGIHFKAQNDVIVKAGENWIPVDTRFDVKEGSVLDLSFVRKSGVPAGKYGYPIAKGNHFEFEKLPGVPQRFYGVNLAFGANFPREEVSPIFAKNLARIGYNAIRVHHHDEQMTNGRDGTLDPESMKLFDALMAACISNGLYITTDFYVSRKVPYRDCGIDRDGKFEMAEFKEMVMFHEGVFSNYIRSARAFLSHVNPHTKRRYADEPALGWISFVNEGNLGNFDMRWMSKNEDMILPKWAKWLDAQKKKDSRYANIPKTLPKSLRGWNGAKKPHSAAFVRFLADVETTFAKRVTNFLRNEMKCKALTTNMNCWYYPSAYQLPRAMAYDYVDDHFYIDHPNFIDQKWRLPSKCPNTNPFKNNNEGAMVPTIRRIFDRPFTITEFNYSSPGRYRGVGGIATGTMAALQDWAGIWRFAWSHGSGGTEAPSHLSYFNVSDDPLTLAAERAIVCLYLREDVKPLRNKLAYHIKPSQVTSFKDTEGVTPGEFNRLGWYSQIGCVVDESLPKTFGLLGTYNGENKEDVKGVTKSETVKIDNKEGKFEINTQFTAGGFAESGKISTDLFSAEISQAPCAVWISSLDTKPINKSSKLLLSHLTDVQNTYMKFMDEDFTILRSWGRLPHLMRRGMASVSIKFDNPDFEVWSINSSGERRERIPAVYKNGRIEFVCDTARDRTSATYLYEITSPLK